MSKNDDTAIFKTFILLGTFAIYVLCLVASIVFYQELYDTCILIGYLLQALYEIPLLIFIFKEVSIKPNYKFKIAVWSLLSIPIIYLFPTKYNTLSNLSFISNIVFLLYSLFMFDASFLHSIFKGNFDNCRR